MCPIMIRTTSGGLRFTDTILRFSIPDSASVSAPASISAFVLAAGVGVVGAGAAGAGARTGLVARFSAIMVSSITMDSATEAALGAERPGHMTQCIAWASLMQTRRQRHDLEEVRWAPGICCVQEAPQGAVGSRYTGIYRRRLSASRIRDDKRISLHGSTAVLAVLTEALPVALTEVEASVEVAAVSAEVVSVASAEAVAEASAEVVAGASVEAVVGIDNVPSSTGRPIQSQLLVAVMHGSVHHLNDNLGQFRG